MNRRRFLVFAATATGAIVWACRRRGEPPAVHELHPLVRIGDDDSVTIVVARTEMGQGVATALPMLLAEELDVDWAKVAIENERFDPRAGDQYTAASISIYEAWQPYRTAGATARALLVAAAAERWGVAADRLRTEAGFLIGPDDARASYGSLVADAARQTAPAKPALKDRAAFRLIGKPLPRLDTAAKIDGTARFGIDVAVPNMLVGCVARAPNPGATPARHDEAAARRIDGVREIVPIASGIAVLADDTWAAKRGVDALAVEWAGGDTRDSAAIAERFARELAQPMTAIRSVGDPAGVLAKAATKLAARYAFPFVPHATMEPVNATAHVELGRCTIWAPTQAPHWNRKVIAQLLGIREDAVDVHRMLAGGGFGRKSCQDFIRDAVEASRAVGRPVKIVYTREDDIRHDYLRPASMHRVEGAVDAGKIVAWNHELVVPSVVASWHPFKKLAPGDNDDLSTAGAERVAYAIPNFRAAARMVDVNVRVGIWRSIAHSYTNYVNETFVDELAHLAHADPVQFRLAHLDGRARRVLELAAERAGWHKPGMGVALSVEADPGDDYAVYVAHVVELTPALAIAKVTVVADCGTIVNPNIARAQLEGGVAWALSAMSLAITFDRDGAQQSNFHDVPVVRMPQMPRVDVHLVESTERASGLGEKGVPSFGPAYANALFAATGKRIRELPMRSA